MNSGSSGPIDARCEEGGVEGVVPAFVLGVVGDRLAYGGHHPTVVWDTAEDGGDERFRHDGEEKAGEAAAVGALPRTQAGELGEEPRARQVDRFLTGGLDDLIGQVVGEQRVPRLVRADLERVAQHRIR
jgi:hypothetical protein